MNQNTINPRTIVGEDRGIPTISSSVSGMSKNSKTAVIFVIGLILVFIIGITIFQKYRFSKKQAEVETVQQAIQPVQSKNMIGLPDPDFIPPDPPKPVVVVASVDTTKTDVPSMIVPPPPPPPPQTKSYGKSASGGKEEVDPVQELMNKRYKSGMGGSKGGRPSPKAEKEAQVDETSSNFGDLLVPTTTAKVKASKLSARDYLLTKGVMIDCTMVTKIDSTLPGMVKCVVAANVFSDNGKTLLVERGSEITGEYRADVRNGQARVFAIWDRVKTPEGIVANLVSPGADPLGASGLSGWVDNHWGQRIGSAILLSVIEGSLDIAKAKAQGSVGVMIGDSSDESQSMASTVLKSTINIPPTIIKNPGESIRIFVARDVSFEGVYQLRLTQEMRETIKQ